MSRRVLALLLVTALAVAGCDEDLALAQDFIKQWALDHAGEIAKNQMGLPSGDAYVDAAVEAGGPILQLKEADEAMAKGRANQDPKSMDAALKLRPKDWTYQLSRADLALQLGDMTTVTKYWYPSFENAPGTPGGIEAYQRQQGQELELVHKRISRGDGSITGYRSYAQCTTLYDQLRQLSLKVTEVSKPPSYWADRRQDCEQIPH
ncbi:MAG: hypothetical protein QOF11_1567 [Chloroflexota bacterium]|jgi:hypothetical protein|nr:hypothetical protein [Chloroflexota bacterium]